MQNDPLAPLFYCKVTDTAVNNIVMCMSDYRRGLDWWLDLFTAYTTRYYTSKITILFTRSSQSVTVFNSRYLVAASNGGRSSCSGFPNCPQPQLPTSNSYSSQRLSGSSPLTNSLTHQPTHTTPLTVNNCPAYNTSAQTTQNTPFLCCSSIVTRGPRRNHHFSVVAAAAVQSPVSRSAPSNGSTCHKINVNHIVIRNKKCHYFNEAYCSPVNTTELYVTRALRLK
jgi:hypothetical protein